MGKIKWCFNMDSCLVKKGHSNTGRCGHNDLVRKYKVT